MNIVPNDILSVTKLLTSISSHTMHWSHKNQSRYTLKRWKTQEMLQMFHSHVSHISWSCCIVLTNLVSLSEWHMLHLSVGHFTFHKEQHTWNIQHVAMFRNYVSCAISSQRDAWCSCSWNAVQMWKLTPGVLQLSSALSNTRGGLRGVGANLMIHAQPHLPIFSKQQPHTIYRKWAWSRVVRFKFFITI